MTDRYECVGSRYSCNAVRFSCKLGGIQLLEGVAKVHQHQIALVAQHGVDRALAGFFGPGQRGDRFARYLLLSRCAELAPLRPAKTKHLVEHAQTFKRKRHSVQFGRYSLRGGIAGRHRGNSRTLTRRCNCKCARPQVGFAAVDKIIVLAVCRR